MVYGEQIRDNRFIIFGKSPMIITRRDAILSIIVLQVPGYKSLALANSSPMTSAETVPNEDGMADYALAWSLEEGGGVALVAAPPDIPRGTAEI